LGINNIYYDLRHTLRFVKTVSKPKTAAYLQAPKAQTIGQTGFTGVLEGKLHFLVIFGFSTA
jgi:hypothetical protein